MTALQDLSALPPRIAIKISKPDANGCWLWMASTSTNGYGAACTGGARREPAHRFVYTALSGPIPQGLQLDHLCRVRRCVNPGHLEPVTQQENIRRGTNARKTHCPHGHEYTPENTYRNPAGHRQCLTCRRRTDRMRPQRRVRAS